MLPSTPHLPDATHADPSGGTKGSTLGAAELVYDHDGIQIWHGDNTDVRPSPEDVDLVLTDPPYGIALDTGYQDRKRGDLATAHNYAPVHGDGEQFDPTWMLEYPKACLWGANHYAHLLPPSGSWVVWDRLDGLWSGKREQGFNDAADAELAWTNQPGTVRTFRHRWNGMHRKGENLYVHPTQKPVELMRWLVERFTEPGDLVYDPYMGSGPIAQACADLGRRYIGVELEREYVDAAIGRLAQQTLALA